VAREKFELVFLGGGAMLNALSTRLRRAPTTPRESIGAAMYTLEQALLRNEPAPQAAHDIALQLRAIREELCAELPRMAVMEPQLDGLKRAVGTERELTDAVRRLRERVAAWLD
jgi:hypothetical protein